jgi:hypothetical protein
MRLLLEFDGDWLSVSKLNFFGQYRRSANGRFILAWHDPCGTANGSGSYLLFRDMVLTAKGKMERPNDGKVADNGTFIINDWLSPDILRGSFYAISSSGKVLIKKTFSANLANNWLSNDGRFAVCQTCTSQSKAHSRVLAVFDLESRKVISQFAPRSGWADEYRVDMQGQVIYLICRRSEGESYRYKLDGTLVGVEVWQEAKK